MPTKEQKKFWTYELYKKVDGLIEDGKLFPLCVPSYGRPNTEIAKYLDKFESSRRIRVFFFVRREQLKIYGGAVTEYKNVNISLVPIDNVNNIGETRAAIVAYCIKQRIPDIFMFDDDCNHVSFTYPGITADGKPKSEYMKDPEPIRVLKMWQYAVQQKRKVEENIFMSGCSFRSFCWGEDACKTKFKFNGGNAIQCVHLSVKAFYKNELQYKPMLCLEDYDIMLQGLYKKLYVVFFPWLMYHVAPMNKSGGIDYGNMREKYAKFVEVIKSSWGEEDLRFSEIRGLPQVRIKWRNFR